MIGRLATFFRLSVRELTVLLVLFAVSLPAVTTRLYASDEVQYYAYLRSLWFDRDVSFDNEYRHFYDAGVARSEGFRATLLELETPTGRRVNFATIGSAILWSPFFAAGDVGARVARAFGSGVAADGYSKPYVAAVCIGSAIYGFAAMLLSVRIARDLTGHGLRAALAVWLGTPLLFYMYLAPVFAHAASAFAVTLFVAVWMHVRRAWQPRGVAMLAAAAALMTMVREQDAFFVIGPIVDFVDALVPTARPEGRSERNRLFGGSLVFAVVAAITFVVVFSPQLAAYQALNGRFGPSPLVSRKMLWWSPHALEVLLSPAHGFLFWTPLALLAFAGLAWFAVRPAVEPRAPSPEPPAPSPEPRAPSPGRRVAVALLAMVAATIYVSGSVDSWSASGAFGQRRFVNLTPLLVVGLAVLFARITSSRGRPLLFAAAALTVWWNLALMAQFGTRMMDRSRLELRSNAYNAFVRLPMEAPALAYRYVFDRASFYQPPVEETR